MSADPIRARFQADHEMTAAKLSQVITLANWCAKANEGECNGDPHADSPDRQDKNANAKCWARDLERNAKLLADAVEPYSLTVHFTGLRPCLRDTAGRYIEIPH